MAENSKIYFALTTAAAALGVMTAVAYIFKRANAKNRQINPMIKKNEKKVTDVVDIEELMDQIKPGGKISFCRCWRSKKWPYCDDEHKHHNQCTGDNVGALNIIRKKASTA